MRLRRSLTIVVIALLIALPLGAAGALLGTTMGWSKAARVLFVPALPGRELAVYAIPCTAWRPGWLVVRSQESHGEGLRSMRIPLSRRFDWDWLEPGNVRLLSLRTWPPCGRVD